MDLRGGSAIISRRATVSDSLLGPKRSVGVSPPKKERKGAGVDDSERDDALDEAGLLEVCHIFIICLISRFSLLNLKMIGLTLLQRVAHNFLNY